MPTNQLGQKVSIQLERYGRTGWFITISNPSSNYTRMLRTNKVGEGLWVMYQNGSEKQRRGTSQFSLSHKRPAAYQKISRMIQKDLLASY